MSFQLSPSGPAALAPDVPLDKQAAFVQTLAQWGNVRAAAQQVGVSRAHLYRMRRASAQFRQLWDAALVLARPQVEEVLADRALNGVQEVVYYHGEEVATRTRYDSRLLLAHLARLDRIAGSAGVSATVADFDAEVERLLDPAAFYDWDDEEEYGDEDAEGWAEEHWADGEDDDAAQEDDAPDEGPGADAAGDGEAGDERDDADAGMDDTGAAADGARGAVSGAAGFAVLDSVSCVSNSRGGEKGHADADRAAEPGGGGPSCRLPLH